MAGARARVAILGGGDALGEGGQLTQQCRNREGVTLNTERRLIWVCEAEGSV